MLVLNLGSKSRVDHTSQHLVKVVYQGPKKVLWQQCGSQDGTNSRPWLT
jgi:hypothetical protein